jgi:hypothetical protein
MYVRILKGDNELNKLLLLQVTLTFMIACESLLIVELK